MEKFGVPGSTLLTLSGEVCDWTLATLTQPGTFDLQLAPHLLEIFDYKCNQIWRSSLQLFCWLTYCLQCCPRQTHDAALVL